LIYKSCGFLNQMECELNGMKIKYDDGKLWVWREKRGNQKLKNPHWFELKGCVDKGYRRVQINNKLYKYHRVVYFIHNDDWDIHDSCRDNSIDHIDRDKLNNNIENLRVVTHQQNQWNKDGKGYYFNKPSGKYLAHIRVDGENKHLGYFTTAEAARDSYLEAKMLLHQILP